MVGGNSPGKMDKYTKVSLKMTFATEWDTSSTQKAKLVNIFGRMGILIINWRTMANRKLDIIKYNDT